MHRFRLKNTGIVFLFFLLNIPALFAQLTGYPVVHKIDESKGLSDNDVQCILKDHQGFMWIGTASGLNLLDGSSITVFKNIPGNVNSISNNFIKSIAESEDGLIWVGTKDGLNCYNPRSQEFTRIPLSADSNEILQVLSIVFDKKNNVVAATLSGLFFYDPQTKKSRKVELPGKNHDKFLNNYITKLRYDKAGKLWLTGYNGLWNYDSHEDKFRHITGSENPDSLFGLYTTLLFDRSGKIWLGTWDNGLKCYLPSANKIISYRSKLFNHNVHTLNEIRQRNGNYVIWINGDTVAIDERSGKFVKIDLPSEFRGLNIRDVYANDAWHWIGTAAGLLYFNPEGNYFKHHDFNTNITNQEVPVLEYENKIFLGGTGPYFLRAYDQHLNQLTNYSSETEKGVSCLAIRKVGENTLRCGTSNGVADVDLLANKTHFYYLRENPNHSSTINFITSLQQNADGSWWLFPWRNGIWKSNADLSKTQIVKDNFINKFGIPKPLVISDACLDKNGNMWCSDYDEGIIFYSQKKNTFSKPFASVLGERIFLPQILCYQNYCYAFTQTTLLRWNVDSMNLQRISVPPQVGKDISSIAFDSIGHLWMATRNGLLSYDFEKKSFAHFTTADGLRTNNLEAILYCLKNGTMLFTTPNHISVFEPSQLLASVRDNIALRFVSMLVNGKPHDIDTSAPMEFHHTANNFIFKWTLADYNDPLQNKYYYLLKGIDKEWRFAGRSGEVAFPNLAPGKYTLLLKAKNSNGIEAQNILQVQFAVLLPFWRTWWFFTILFCCAGSLFYILYRYRLNQHLKIEKLRNKISGDLHDDIGSTLSSITILSDMALNTNLEKKEMLREIKESSLGLMEKMDDIVWAINPRNDTSDNLFLRIQSFASKVFEGKNIRYQIKIDEQLHPLHIPMEQRQNLYLLIKEAINNIAKHSCCTEAGLEICLRPPFIAINVWDNGKGFDTKNDSTGNGLRNMKNRARQLEAPLDIRSKKEEGTKICLRLKIT